MEDCKKFPLCVKRSKLPLNDPLENCVVVPPVFGGFNPQVQIDLPVKN
jgi:hypothetical protein